MVDILDTYFSKEDILYLEAETCLVRTLPFEVMTWCEKLPWLLFLLNFGTLMYVIHQLRDSQRFVILSIVDTVSDFGFGYDVHY